MLENIISDVMALLIPIGICIVLPIAIVYIRSKAATKNEEKRAEIIIKAIEANRDVDTDKLLESLKKPARTEREIRNARLLRGCMFSLVGLAIFIVEACFVLSGGFLSQSDMVLWAITGGACLAVGISYLVVWYVTRTQVQDPEEA